VGVNPVRDLLRNIIAAHGGRIAQSAFGGLHYSCNVRRQRLQIFFKTLITNEVLDGKFLTGSTPVRLYALQDPHPEKNGNQAASPVRNKRQRNPDHRQQSQVHADVYESLGNQKG